MRILYITASFQHPKVRGPKRCYHFIRELSKRHAITLLTLKRSNVIPEALQEMGSYTERIVTFDAIKSSEPINGKKFGAISRFNYKVKNALKMRKAVSEMKAFFLQLVQQESYDVILFHGKSVFEVIKDWNGLPIVVDFCDATSMRIKGWMRHANLAKLLWLLLRFIKVWQIEKKLLNKTSHLAFISARDRSAILGSNNGGLIIPLGVDLNYWTRRTHSPQPNCILYTGGMDYAPNADGAFYLIDKILPLLRQFVPNLEVFIVGGNPSPLLKQKARENPDVTVTGFVEDMRPYFERATVYAAPLRFASGMQNKLLEALAMEVPVVTAPVAANGLCVNGSMSPPLLVAEGERQFAEKIIYLLKNKKERVRLAAEGRRFIQNNFVWSHHVATLENLCLEAVKQHQQSKHDLMVSKS